jgi:hypothetical protein
MYTFDEILNPLLISQAAFTAAYLIAALIVCSNTFAGANAVLLGLLCVAFLTITYHVLKRELNRFNFGVLLGGGATLIFISLQAAIFWGEYSKCVKPDSLIDLINSWNHDPGIGPQCHYRHAMSVLCAFSVLLFLSYVVQIGAMLHFKNEILAEVPYGTSSYRPIPSTSSQLLQHQHQPTPQQASSHQHHPHSFQQPAQLPLPTRYVMQFLLEPAISLIPTTIACYPN